MNSESELVINLWEAISEYIPPAKRLEAAVKIIRAVEDYGVEISDLGHVSDEDPLLAKAFQEVAGDEEDESEDDYDSEDE